VARLAPARANGGDRSWLGRGPRGVDRRGPEQNQGLPAKPRAISDKTKLGFPIGQRWTVEEHGFRPFQ
jgi:hypothetical protein